MTWHEEQAECRLRLDELSKVDWAERTDMNSKQRVVDSIDHKQTDRIPYHIDFTEVCHERMARFYGDPEFLAKPDNCLARHVLCGISDRFITVGDDR